MAAMNQWEKNEVRFFRVMTILALSLMGVCRVATLIIGTASRTGGASQELNAKEEGEEPASPTGGEPVDITDRLLGETADMGEGYIDRMIFVGESTTAHLRSRGVLREGQATEQVWSDASGTMTLDLNVLQKPINYPPTGRPMTIAAAVGAAKPQYLVLSFGVNGIVGFSRNEALYERAYGKLIDAIHAASPDTVVMLQTVYPVATNQTAFSEGATIINGYVRRRNEQLLDIAQAHDAYVVNTASVLCDSAGNLKAEYQTGDGIHLTAEAYRRILQYLRTHGYVGKEDDGA